MCSLHPHWKKKKTLHDLLHIKVANVRILKLNLSLLDWSSVFYNRWRLVIFRWSRLRGSWMTLRQTCLPWRGRAWSWRRSSAAVRKVLFPLFSHMTRVHSATLDTIMKPAFDFWFPVTRSDQSYWYSEAKKGPSVSFPLFLWTTSIHILIFYCQMPNPSAVSPSCDLVASHICSLRAAGLRARWNYLPFLLTVSSAKWGERRSQPTGVLLLLWGSRSRGADCFAQGQRDLCIVIYSGRLLTFFFFPLYAPPRKPQNAISWPEFDINCTPPRRSSASQLEFME